MLNKKNVEEERSKQKEEEEEEERERERERESFQRSEVRWWAVYG